MLTITPLAVQKCIGMMNDNTLGLRVKVEGGGCSGFQYVWDLKSNWPDVKWSDPIEDVLVVDPVAEIYLLGSTVDYIEELGGSFLSITNPMSSSSCGCGESFGI